jgi:putative phage-type endonuclease
MSTSVRRFDPAVRRRSLGASDAPVIAGLSRYKSRYALWLEKTGEAISDDGMSEEAWFGLQMEPIIQHRLYEHHDVSMADHQVSMVHEREPWLTATIDAVDLAGDVWEFKTAGIGTAKGLENGDAHTLPNSWVLQAHHQMAVAQRDRVRFAVFAGHALRLWTFDVQFDSLLWSELFSLEREFWDRVEKRIPPTEFDAADVKLLTERFRGSEPEIELDGVLHPYCEEYQESCRLAKFYQERADVAKATLLAALENAKAATCGPYRITRSVVNVKADPTPKPRDGYSYVRFSFKNRESVNE